MDDKCGRNEQARRWLRGMDISSSLDQEHISISETRSSCKTFSSKFNDHSSITSNNLLPTHCQEEITNGLNKLYIRPVLHHFTPLLSRQTKQPFVCVYETCTCVKTILETHETEIRWTEVFLVRTLDESIPIGSPLEFSSVVGIW